MTEEKRSDGWKNKSKFFLGEKAFNTINELLMSALSLGHNARTSMKINDILDYYNALKTLSIPIDSVLDNEDKATLDAKFKSLIDLKHIDPYHKQISKKRIYIIKELTEMEKIIYRAMQNIDMYISIIKPVKKKSQVRSFKTMFSGSSKPVDKNEYEDDQFE